MAQWLLTQIAADIVLMAVALDPLKQHLTGMAQVCASTLTCSRLDLHFADDALTHIMCLAVFLAIDYDLLQGHWPHALVHVVANKQAAPIAHSPCSYVHALFAYLDPFGFWSTLKYCY
jgi:hypothetical protein